MALVELAPYGGRFRTGDSSDSGVLLFVLDGKHLTESVTGGGAAERDTAHSVNAVYHSIS